MSVGRSTDGGASWTHQQISGTNGFVYCMTLDPSHPDTVYAGGYEGSTAAFYRTLDGGTSWTKYTPAAIGSNAIYAMAVSPGDPQTVFAGTGNGIYRSTDFGATFTKVSSTIGYVRDIIAEPGRIWLATSSQGVFTSSDGGSNWSTMNEGLTELSVNRLAIDPGLYLFAGTDGAASFRWPLALGVEEEGSSQAWGSDLFASPNPASDGAMIHYTVSSSEFVTLAVYDMQGRIVSTIGEGSRAPGSYEVWWNGRSGSGSDLQPGVYLLRLVCGREVSTGRLVLVR